MAIFRLPISLQSLCMQLFLFSTSAAAQQNILTPEAKLNLTSEWQVLQGKKIREFVSYQYRELAIDIVVGHGDHLKALNELSTSKEANKNHLPITAIQEKLFELKDPALLANYLADLLTKNE